MGLFDLIEGVAKATVKIATLPIAIVDDELGNGDGKSTQRLLKSSKRNFDKGMYGKKY
jgi:hypothetical protein